MSDKILSLVLSLNENLSIYSIDEKKTCTLIFKQEKINKALDLSDNFDKTFITLPEALEYYLFIGDQAGFMDSRIVYIWLSNKACFDNVKYYVTRNNFNISQYNNLLTKAKLDNFQDLAYSREPNIGNKK